MNLAQKKILILKKKSWKKKKKESTNLPQFCFTDEMLTVGTSLHSNLLNRIFFFLPCVLFSRPIRDMQFRKDEVAKKYVTGTKPGEGISSFKSFGADQTQTQRVHWETGSLCMH